MHNKTKIFLLILFIIFQPTSTEASEIENFEIKHADILEAEKGHIAIKGNVSVNLRDTIIEANEAFIELDLDGKPHTGTFYENAKIKLKDKNLKANKIKILIENELIIAEGNVISELKDKKNDLLTINSDYQELSFSKENESANARGNLNTTYQETKVKADKLKIIYKDKKPHEAIFLGILKPTNLEQPTNFTSAKEIRFDINTQNVYAIGDVKTTIWPDKNLSKTNQDPVQVISEEVFIDNKKNIVTAKGNQEKKVKLSYGETKGESNEAILFKENKNGRPEKVIFKGNASVSQLDKELISEEVAFNFKDKKLTSQAMTNVRPKTTIYKKG